ncbi:hypothetical protein KRR40_30705 [Niabella defluvii]|nr:hypothetical protein KRR40_30705 [Niabella sp. I65]
MVAEPDNDPIMITCFSGVDNELMITGFLPVTASISRCNSNAALCTSFSSAGSTNIDVALTTSATGKLEPLFFR